MATSPAPETIAAAIQLAVAPVFLLTGVGAMLNVLTHRLSRIIDRARALEAALPGYPGDRRSKAMRELAVLGRRMAAAHWAILLCTGAALLVCVVVALLFVGELDGNRMIAGIGWLFIAATVLLIAGLLMFLIELQIALRSVKVGAARELE